MSPALRNALLALVAAAAAAAGAVAGAGVSPKAPRTTERAASTGSPSRPRAAGGLPLSRAVGRKIITGMAGRFPSRSLRARVRRGEVGGVILFGPNVGHGL